MAKGLGCEAGELRVFKVGTSEFRNVLVFVSDRDNLLGLDLISKLGRLKITRKDPGAQRRACRAL